MLRLPITRQVGVLLTLAALLLGAVGPASAAGLTLDGAILRTKTIQIGPASAGGGKARCPQGYRIISGGALFPVASPPYISWSLSASMPVDGATAWYAAGRNSESGGPATLTVVAHCLPAARVGTYVRMVVTAALDGGGISGAYAICPSGYRVVAGGGIWQVSGDPPSPSIALTTVLASVSPTQQANGWYADGRQSPTGTARLKVVALCRPSAKVGSYSTVIVDLQTAEAARAGSYASCPAGTRIVASGAYSHQGVRARDPTSRRGRCGARPPRRTARAASRRHSAQPWSCTAAPGVDAAHSRSPAAALLERVASEA